MATNSIAELLAARPPKPSSRGAINILARQAARKAVREQLLSESKRLSRVKAADIAAMAQQYLEAHPELYLVARERAIKMGMKDQDLPKDDAVVEEPTCRDKPLPPETPKPEGWGEKPKRSLIEKLKRLLQRVFGM
jgi:hypothetical protein